MSRLSRGRTFILRRVAIDKVRDKVRYKGIEPEGPAQSLGKAGRASCRPSHPGGLSVDHAASKKSSPSMRPVRTRVSAICSLAPRVETPLRMKARFGGGS